uniref:transcription elongation factor SPT6 isoform X2 n=1 Tax=Myxine glutinosa TaxID=7769 RepID=UPI00358E2347
MSDFVDSEAEEESVEEESVVEDLNEEEQQYVKKRSSHEKKSRKFVHSTDDDEEEDENEPDENLKDFINDDEDDDEEEEEGEVSERDAVHRRSSWQSGQEDDTANSDENENVDDEEKRHRRKRKHAFDDRLEEDDYMLIEENLGVRVNRDRKFRRLREQSDSEDDDRPQDSGQDDKEFIAGRLFSEGKDGAEESIELVRPSEETLPGPEYDDERSDSDSDMSNFIVGDDGQPIRQHRHRKRIPGCTDAALQEAQEIFGVDFDFAEFEDYGQRYPDDEFDEDVVDDVVDESDWDDEEGGRRTTPATRHKKPSKKHGVTSRSIFEVYEPSELERSHLTDQDNEIRATDMPERFQLRGIPMEKGDEVELDEEAHWIYKQAFTSPSLSIQELGDQPDRPGLPTGYGRKGPGTVTRIREALNFMRNKQLEVPFIAFYRKEYVEPELTLVDLWRVWQWEEKWTQLKRRKANLARLFQKMQKFQFELISSDPDKPLSDGVRPLDSQDLERLTEVQSMEELQDCYQHFLLYYGRDVPRMQNAARNRSRQTAANSGAAGGTAGDIGDNEEEESAGPELKQASRRDKYSICQNAGLDGLAKKFGLTPEQFGENLRDSYQRHETEQFPAEPLELARDYICGQFPTGETVLEGARFMVALMLAREPLVRQVVRQTYQERAKVNILPTKKGRKEIDEAHYAYQFKYMSNKPVKEVKGDEFLRMTLAEQEGLVIMDISVDMKGPCFEGDPTYYDEIKQFYYRDEFSHQVQEWNRQRGLAVATALNACLYPQLGREIRHRLLAEAQTHVIRCCAQKLRSFLQVAPYQPDQQQEDDDDLMGDSGTRGLRVLGLAYSPEWNTPVFCALVNGEGEVTDFLRLPHFMKRKNARREDDREKKVADMESLKQFILNKKPQVVVVGGENRDALMVVEDVRRVVSDAEQEQAGSPVAVELIPTDLSILYMNGRAAETEFREYPPVLRQAVSLARRLQDPLGEFAQVCQGEDVLCLKLHPLQEHIVKEDLLWALNSEFVSRVNEVGVDLNRCLVHMHIQPLLQHICGLGPRKVAHIIKILKQNNQRLENRTQLVTTCHMGPTVFINCAGFIRIDTAALGDSTEAYIEVLDGSRIHPETYEWARKMAVDALEYDEAAEGANPAEALVEILDNPDRLKDLDLDAFAEELERQGYGNKGVTLYDIRAELSCRYKDHRTPFRPPTPEEIFNMLTKETPETFYVGKLVTCMVTGIARRRPQGESNDQAIRIDSTGLWQCPFCQQDDFPELSEVWNHFDSGACPGQAIGVKTRLDNGVSGFIPTRALSDNVVRHPEERVKVEMTVHVRVTKIDVERFSVDLTSRTSDLLDRSGEWHPARDVYFDTDKEEAQEKTDQEQQKRQHRATYVKRVIVHPSFRNINFKEAERAMEELDQGDVIVRPSSKGTDHLTVTWKVTDGVYQHLDVREQGKENAFSLGQALYIGGEEFEDLDEIIARHIQPMASYTRDLLAHKYYQHCGGGNKKVMEELLIKMKKEKPSQIPYYVSASRELPGKFLLGYQPRNKPRVEYVTVTPDGFRFRGQTFQSMNGLFRWFKEHFRDPIPGVTPGSGSSTRRTPGSLSNTPSNISLAELQRAVSSLGPGVTSQMYNALATVTGQTPSGTPAQWGPSGGQYPFGGSSAYHSFPTPAQQSLATPLLTPAYPHSTPNQQPLTTPNQQPIVTPNQHPVTTPTQSITTPTQQSLSTPTHPLSTPNQTSWGAPPASLPRARTPTTPRSTPTATDWAKMAEQWRQKREQEQRRQKGAAGIRGGVGAAGRLGLTPTPSPSPASESLPFSTAGDATPLLDETDR